MFLKNTSQSICFCKLKISNKVPSQVQSRLISLKSRLELRQVPRAVWKKTNKPWSLEFRPRSWGSRVSETGAVWEESWYCCQAHSPAHTCTHSVWIHKWHVRSLPYTAHIVSCGRHLLFTCRGDRTQNPKLLPTVTLAACAVACVCVKGWMGGHYKLLLQWQW